MEKLKNKKINIEKELLSILDKDYFHICLEFDDSMQGMTKWKVFYSNLEEEYYFSEDNKALLTSEENGLKDIYELRDKFERIKREYYEKNLYTLLRNTFKTYWSFYEIKQKSCNALMNIYSWYALAMLFVSIFIKDLRLTFTNMTLAISTAVYIIVKNKKLSEELQDLRKDMMEMNLKELMKKDGKVIISRLHKELKYENYRM